MTTLRQKLVRKKNRKLRRLRELYPDINIKLFYARDFRALMLKYGKVALVDGLSGSSGQVAVPARRATGRRSPVALARPTPAGRAALRSARPAARAPTHAAAAPASTPMTRGSPRDRRHATACTPTSARSS